MKLKLFKKYFFTTSLIIVFSLSVMMMILSFALNNHLAKEKYKSLSKSCTEVTEYISELSDGKIGEEDFVKTLNAVASVSDADIFICDSTGSVIVCGCDDWINDGKCFHSEKILSKDALNTVGGHSSFKLGTLDMYKNPHYIASEPIYNTDNERIGTVFSVAPLSAIRELMFTIIRLYLLSAVIPIILMFFAIYTMTYRMTKPLKLMSEASKAMAKGDFSKRIPVTSDDEIGELAVSFNQMTNSLVQLEGMR